MPSETLDFYDWYPEAEVLLEPEAELSAEEYLRELMQSGEQALEPGQELENYQDMSWREEFIREISKVDNPLMRTELCSEVDRITEMERDMQHQLATGEMDQLNAELTAMHELRPARARLATRTGLATVDLDYAHLGELADMADDLQRGNLENLEANEEISGMLDELDEGQAEQIAQDKLEQGELDEEGYGLIRRKARLQRLRNTGEETP